MNALGRKIAELIRAEGPIGIDRFWDLALFDRDHGYYNAREPFGRGGDFITAPEVSQMFGELIGAWLAGAWRELGAPSPFVLAEIGPGRGTLMGDILRTLAKVAPDCLKAARVRMVETSDRLAALQLQHLERFDLPIRRLRGIEELDSGPILVVSNELFDALAIRQFVFDGKAWRERCVGVAPGGRFDFVLRPAPSFVAAILAPMGLAAPLAGAVLELSPARERLAAIIARRIAQAGGAGLFVDYGHGRPAYGDTLQAMREHAYAEVLDRPGENDLTSHVDFSRLAPAFLAAGLAVSPLSTQGDFLTSLGLVERAGLLGRDAGAKQRGEIVSAVERLAGTGPMQMGELFKVLAVASSPLSLPPFKPSAA